jgi:hypothetical protein
MGRTPDSNDLLMRPSALNVDPDLGCHRAQDRVRDLHSLTPPVAREKMFA